MFFYFCQAFFITFYRNVLLFVIIYDYTLGMNITFNGFWEKFLSYLGLNGYSLNRACAKMGIPYTTLVSCKNKNQLPSKKYQQQIADFIGCSVEELINNKWNPLSIKAENDKKSFIDNSKKFISLDYIGPMAKPEIVLDKNNNYLLKEDDLSVDKYSLSSLFSIGSYDDYELLTIIRMPDEGMKEISLNEGDCVFFIRNGLDSSEGRFVVSINNKLTVRDLSFDNYNFKLTVFSKNKNFQTIIDQDNRIKVIGRVVGWLHIENQ